MLLNKKNKKNFYQYKCMVASHFKSIYCTKNISIYAICILNEI